MSNILGTYLEKEINKKIRNAHKLYFLNILFCIEMKVNNKDGK